MKKLLCTLFIVMIIPITLVGCGQQESSVSDEAEHYLASTIAVQAFDERKIEEEKYEASLIQPVSSQTIGDTVFLRYKIGSISGCFIQHATTPVYNDRGLNTMEFTTGSLTAQTVSDGISNSISTSSSVSLTNESATNISWNVTDSSTTTQKNSVSVNVSLFDGGVGANNSYEVAFQSGHSESQGGSVSQISSETIADEATRSSNKSYNVDDLKQKVQQTKLVYDMNAYQKNRYYSLALLAEVEIYQIIAYSNITGNFYTSYFTASIESESVALRMVYSETEKFEITPEYKIHPITEVSVTPEGKKVEVDLSEYNEYYVADLKNFEHIYYDQQTSIFTAYGSINGTNVDKYIFRGNYQQPDLLGRYVETSFKGLSIRVFSEHDIELVFENISFSATNGLPAIYLDDGIKNKDIVVTITGMGGQNIIVGNNAQDCNEDGGVAISIPHLIFKGDAELYIAGGNGADSPSYLKDASDGGAAVISKDIVVENGALLSLCGGSGGNGNNGIDGQDGSNGADIGWFKGTGKSRPGGDGQQGTRGSNGGNSGSSVVCDNIAVKTGSKILCTSLTSGSGGHGGGGGSGGHGGTNNWWWGYKGGHPGSGADGGDAGLTGDSGNAYLLLNYLDVFSIEKGASLTLERGEFGTLAKGGAAGLKGGSSGDPDGDATGGIDGEPGKNGSINGFGYDLPERITYLDGLWR